MRICHIITRMIIGGAQENTLLSCVGLHELGHEVTLVTGPETGPEGNLLERAGTHGFAVEIVPHLRRAVNPLGDWKALRELTRLLVALKPDVVHTHSSKAGILGRVAARRAGVPHIVHTVHGMSFNRTQPVWNRALYRGLERYCARFTDRLVCVADAMARQTVDAGIASADKCTTVYSGIQTDWFAPGRWERSELLGEWHFDDDAIVVGTVARLFTNKGYEQLIPAIARAVGKQPRLRFVWVGDGRCRPDYERQLRELGLGDHVHMTGLVAPDEVARLVAGMDFVVHASQWEGLPRIAAQALLMERPVISFAIDGAPEVVIPDETGLLVELNDIAGLADAIVALADNPQRRAAMGRAGRQRCLRQFDYRVMVDALERLYNELAEQRCPHRSAR